MSDFWKNVVGGYVGFGLYVGLLRSESPAAALAVVALAVVTLWLSLEVHVWLVFRAPAPEGSEG